MKCSSGGLGGGGEKNVELVEVGSILPQPRSWGLGFTKHVNSTSIKIIEDTNLNKLEDKEADK